MTLGGSRAVQDVRPALDVAGLTKRFGGAYALQDVDLAIFPGQIHALVGENGSGKSTLIKILSGYHVPEPGGLITVGGVRMKVGSPLEAHRLGCRFVHQELGLVDDLSVADNLALSGGYPTRLATIRSGKLRAAVTEELRAIGVQCDPEQKVGELTPVSKAGVAMARALRHDGKHGVAVLVLDEPSATLPLAELARLHATVRAVAAGGVAVLYVTHHLAEVFDLSQTVTVLRDGRKVTSGATASLTRRALVHHLVGANLEDSSTAPRPASGARRVLTVDRLTATGVEVASLDVHAGEIVGVAGVSGSGREALLPALFGATERTGGAVLVNGVEMAAGRPRSAMDLGVAYLPPDRKTQGGAMALSARENLTLAHLGPAWRFPAIRRRIESVEALAWFERLHIRPSTATEARLETFSGGNQQKVLFAKWLRRQPQLLLLEEPTQGVDVGAKLLLHGQVMAAASTGAAILVSSADNEELLALCHRVLVLVRGSVVEELSGAQLSSKALSAAILSIERRSA